MEKIFVENYGGAVKATVSFVQPETVAEGETILADVWEIGAETKTARVSSGSDVAPAKGETVTMTIDMDDVSAGVYSVKFWCDGVGVLERAKLIVK